MKKINTINTKLLTLFSGVLSDGSTNNSSSKFLKSTNTFIPADAVYASSEIKQFIASKNLQNINKTFYENWNVVGSKSREEMLEEQIRHYMTTYGSDFQSETVYIPNEYFEDQTTGDFKVFVIKSLTEQEVTDKVKVMLCSGVALTQDTIESLLYLMEELSIHVDTDDIRNREAQCIIAVKSKQFPTNADAAMRCLYFMLSGETMLVKPTKTNISKFATTKLIAPVDNDIIKTIGHGLLAQVFNRYKNVFFAIRSRYPALRKDINKVSRMSKFKHVPQVQNPLNQVTAKRIEREDMHWLSNATIYALFKAYNACNLYSSKVTDAYMFTVRSGRSWITTKSGRTSEQIDAMFHNMNLIKQEIKNRLNHLEGKKVFITDGIEYGLPTSEKMFVERIPFGTRFTNTDGFNVGVYWQNDFGVTDLDLSGVTDYGTYYGFYGSYNNDHIKYSGDVTYAPSGAVEYLSITPKTTATNVIVNANGYSSNPTWKCRVILGKLDNNYKDMMKPENLIFSEQFDSKGRGATLGVFVKNDDGSLSFVVYPSANSDSIITRSDDTTALTRVAIVEAAKYNSTLNEVLKISGAELVTDKQEADIDLSIEMVDKSTFIQLLSAN